MTESDPGSGPRLFLMCGLPGAGKTTRAKELEKEHHAVRLTPDDWLLAIHLPDWTREDHDALRTPLETLQWSVAKRLLELGINVIIDWGLWGRDERDELRKQAKKFGARVEVVFLNPPRDVLLERLAARRVGQSDLTFCVSDEELDLWAAGMQNPTPDDLGP